MQGITVQDGDEDKLVTDIEPYRQERERIIGHLLAMFEGVELADVAKLLPREAEVVELHNRLIVLDAMLVRWEEARAHNNLKIVWERVLELRKETVE